MENKRASLVKTTMSRRKRKTMATIGAVVFVMAVVGVITVAIGSVNLTGRLLDNSKEKQKLEHFLLPLVMLDPGDFESPQQADPLMILQSSIWSVLLSKNRDDLTKDDQGVVVAASDVEVQAAKLYGTEVKLQHQSIDNYEEQIKYNPETKMYSIPMISQMAVYTPRILKVSSKGDIYTLDVGYIPPGNLWQTDADGNTYEPDPDKVMTVVLKKVKSGYNIISIKNAEELAIPIAPTNSQVTPEVSSATEAEESTSVGDASASEAKSEASASASVSEAFADASSLSMSESSALSQGSSRSSSASDSSSSEDSSSS
ncbi:MAG: hypothetical protein RR115_04150 [Hydrogenoanaerobacterium sp.]